MEDLKIINLFYERSELAIKETSGKYGAYLKQVAYNILRDLCDTEEVVNDTYMGAWKAIPPTRPSNLKHFLSRITRNLSFDRLDYRTAGKRQAFLDGYDTDGAIISEIGNSSLDLDSRYSLYYVYTQEMGDTLDEIVQKYHLKLHTDIDSISPQELVYRLGKDFMTENCTKYWSYIYEDGSFAFDGDMTLDNGEVISYQFKRVVKGTFDEVILNIGDAADYKECPYMTAGGEEVMLAFGADKSLIYVDFEDCFITINVLCGNENGMTEENLKQLAEAVDFTMLKEVRAPEMRGDSE